MERWTLLHPWLLVGLAAASLPIVIHLIGRRRAPTVHFAAFDFLLAINRRLARRERLRQLLLLLMRTLALAVLAVAVARPVPSRTQSLQNKHRRVALVLDTSASMGYRLHGKTLLSRGIARARNILSHLQVGDMASLVTTGPEVRAPVQVPTLDLSKVRRALADIHGAAGVADMAGAIETAVAQLGDSGEDARLVIISDMAQSSFTGVALPSIVKPPEFQLIDAAEREGPTPLPNLAIEEVHVGLSPDSAAERAFKIVVRNYGGRAVDKRPMELLINGAVTHKSYVSLPARSVTEKVLTHRFETPGVFEAQVRLLPDAQDGFALDDEAHLTVQVAPGVQALAINGDPRTTPHEDELFFLERALEAVPRGEPPIGLKIVTVDELGALAEDLGTLFDLVILANVATLPPRQVQRLARFVHQGGGLLVTLGDRVDFEQANKRFAPILPHPLRDLHQAADKAAGTPPLGIDAFDWDHAALRELGPAFKESLRASRTRAYFNVDVGAERTARVLLRFDNAAPALLESRQAGEGRVLVLTTSVDVDLSDLAIRSGFPALMQRCVRYLADAAPSTEVVQIRPDSRVSLAIPTAVRGIALVSPRGERREIMLKQSNRRRVELSGLNEVGIYHVELLRKAWQREPRLDVAANPRLDESDFFPLRPERLAEALGTPPGDELPLLAMSGTADTDPFATRGAATYLLLALCLLFFSESLLAARG